MTHKIASGAQILFRDSIDYAPAANNVLAVGTPDTFVQLDMTGLLTGGYRASAKVDLGASRDQVWAVSGCAESVSAPTDAELVPLYWAESPSGTAAVANPAGLSGTDEAVTDTSGLLGQLTRIGSISLRAATINIDTKIGNIVPMHRYGILVVGNEGTPNFQTDAVEMSILFTAIENSDV